MGAQFASFRDTNSNANYIVSAGGSISTSSSLWYSIVFSNLAGFNQGSPLQQVTINAGEQLEVQLDNSLLASGELPERIYLMASTTNDATQRRVIAYADTRNLDGTAAASISSIIIDNDAFLLLNEAVADGLALTALTDLLPGMRRQVLSTGFVYQYEPDSAELIDNSEVIATNTIGRWIRVSSFLGDIADTTSVGGANQILLSINPIDQPQDINYPFDGSVGRSVGYWYLNNTGASLEQGTRIALQILLDLKAQSNRFKNKVVVRFVGYVNQTTGILDTSMPSSGSTFNWDPQDISQMVLTADLPVDSAVYYEIYLQAHLDDFGGTLPPSTSLGFYLFPQPLSAVAAPFAVVTGDFVAPGASLRLIVPGTGLSTNGLSGQVVVDGLMSTVSGVTPVTGYLGNTDNQLVITDGSGVLNVEQSGYLIPDVEAQRSVVGSLAGIGNPVDLGQVVLGSPSSIEIDLSHPVDANNFGIIRSDYLDPLLAGRGPEEGIVFNPPTLNIYLDDGSDIYLTASLPVLTQPNQNFSISGLGSAGATLPSNIADFGLYSADSAVLTSGAGTIPAGTYQVYAAYVYNGNQITRISHSVADGNIPTFQDGFSDLLALAQCYGCPEPNYQALRDKTSIPAYFITSVIPSGTISGKQEQWGYDPTGTDPDDGSTILTLTSGPGNWVLLGGTGSGGGSNGLVTTNRATLTGTFQLLPASDTYQFLDGAGGTFDVVLPDPPSTGNYFVIEAIGTGTLNIKETAAGATEISLSNVSGQPYRIVAVYDGTDWNVTAFIHV